MPSSQLPAETIELVLHYTGDDQKTHLNAGAVARSWLRQQRRSYFKRLSFRNQKHIVTFNDLTKSPECTFPTNIGDENISFYGLRKMTRQGSAAMKTVLARSASPRSLTIGIVGGKIPRPVLRAIEAWRGGLLELKIVGGAHNPDTLFAILSSLPYVEKLELEDFKFKQMNSWWQPLDLSYAFPATLNALSVIGDASPFKFFMDHMVASGGFSEVKTLVVQTRFLHEDLGIPEVFDTIRVSKTISTVKFCPTYDPSCPDIDRDMHSIFSSTNRPLLKIRGLKSLEIDFTDTPAEFALGCLTTCAAFLPNRRNGLNVEIRVPRSMELWDEQGPAVQLEQLLEQVDHPNPLERGLSQSTLVVRDFPADIPDRFKEAPTVCGFPVTFIDAGVYVDGSGARL